MKQQENKAVCEACRQYLDAHYKWEDELSQDDLLSGYQMLNYCENKLEKGQFEALQRITEATKKRVQSMTAWRIEGTLREFQKFSPVNMWFDYPVHTVDASGVLGDIQPEPEKALRGSVELKRSRKTLRTEKADRKKALEEAIEGCNFGETPTINQVAEYLGISERTARDRIKSMEGYTSENGNIRKKDKK